MTPLIDLGQNYEFVVTDRGQVPPLTCDIDFPDYAPYLTEPSMMETVELSGFTVTWEDGHGGDATLSLALVPGDTTVTGVYINTANDGSHTFTAGDLSGLNPGAHAIALNFYTTESIDAQGYDSESFIQAKVTSAVDVYLE